MIVFATDDAGHFIIRIILSLVICTIVLPIKFAIASRVTSFLANIAIRLTLTVIAVVIIVVGIIAIIRIIIFILIIAEVIIVIINSLTDDKCSVLRIAIVDCLVIRCVSLDDIDVCLFLRKTHAVLIVKLYGAINSLT